MQAAPACRVCVSQAVSGMAGGMVERAWEAVRAEDLVKLNQSEGLAGWSVEAPRQTLARTKAEVQAELSGRSNSSIYDPEPVNAVHELYKKEGKAGLAAPNEEQLLERELGRARSHGATARTGPLQPKSHLPRNSTPSFKVQRQASSHQAIQPLDVVVQQLQQTRTLASKWWEEREAARKVFEAGVQLEAMDEAEPQAQAEPVAQVVVAVVDEAEPELVVAIEPEAKHVVSLAVEKPGVGSMSGWVSRMAQRARAALDRIRPYLPSWRRLVFLCLLR